MAGIGDYSKKSKGNRGFKMNNQSMSNYQLHSSSGTNKAKDSPFKVIPLLVMAGQQLMGGMMKHGAKKSQAKVDAAATEARSTQFKTPEITKKVDPGKYSSGPVNQPLNLPEVPKNKGFNF